WYRYRMSSKADYSPWPHDFLCSLSGLFNATPPDQQEILRQRISNIGLPPGVGEELARLYFPLAVYLEERLADATPPVILGINGAQGTGKSPAAMILKLLLERRPSRGVCTISIDDIYLTREGRRDLANRVHPLLSTRGVPGTHDIGLGL